MNTDVCDAIGESIMKYHRGNIGGRYHIDGVRAFLRAMDEFGFSIVSSNWHEELLAKALKFERVVDFVERESK